MVTPRSSQVRSVGSGSGAPAAPIVRSAERSRVAKPGLAGHRVEHGRDGEERVDPLLLDHGERLGRVEAAHDHRAAAAQQRRVDRAVEAADVEQRGQGQRALGRPEVEAEQLVGRVPRHVAVGEHGALGLPGGAGGVHDQARVVEGDRLVARLGRGSGQQLLVGQRVRRRRRPAVRRRPRPGRRAAGPAARRPARRGRGRARPRTRRSGSARTRPPAR